jgi:YVTN family beta-propeller protein
VGIAPTAMAADPATGTVYVADGLDNGAVSVIDAATNKVTTTVAVGAGPDAVAVDPATHAVYVANYADNTVSVISAPRPAPAITMTSSRNPATFGQNLTLTATAGPADGGTITFTAGRDTITAAYPGDPGYAPAAATLTQTITRAPTTLTERTRTTPHHTLTLTATCATAAQPGPHHAPIQARYPGNTSYQPSSATATPPS